MVLPPKRLSVAQLRSLATGQGSIQGGNYQSNQQSNQPIPAPKPEPARQKVSDKVLGLQQALSEKHGIKTYNLSGKINFQKGQGVTVRAKQYAIAKPATPEYKGAFYGVDPIIQERPQTQLGPTQPKQGGWFDNLQSNIGGGLKAVEGFFTPQQAYGMGGHAANVVNYADQTQQTQQTNQPTNNTQNIPQDKSKNTVTVYKKDGTSSNVTPSTADRLVARGAHSLTPPAKIVQRDMFSANIDNSDRYIDPDVFAPGISSNDKPQPTQKTNAQLKYDQAMAKQKETNDQNDIRKAQYNELLGITDNKKYSRDGEWMKAQLGGLNSSAYPTKAQGTIKNPYGNFANTNFASGKPSSTSKARLTESEQEKMIDPFANPNRKEDKKKKPIHHEVNLSESIGINDSANFGF